MNIRELFILKNWYTRQEVADLLGVSKATVYHYAKQKKIIKIEDPHRLIREARYEREEVDALAEERKRNEPTGLRPSELAKQLGVPTQRIYALIQETDLPIEELPLGDERTIYSISEEAAAWIRREITRKAPVRGTRAEFYDSTYDVALYQLFEADNGQSVRVLRNDNQDWGFYLQSSIWIPFTTAVEMYHYKAAYPIHQKTMAIRGYTDFSLPKELPTSYVFLDFVYEVWGIENIRIREHDTTIELSIKSGEISLSIALPDAITRDLIDELLVAGDILIQEEEWHLMSGYRRTTFDLPTNMLDSLQSIAKGIDLSMSEYVEEAIREKFEREK